MRDIGIGGGAKNVYDHLQLLTERGHECEVVYLGGSPKWYYRKPIFKFKNCLNEKEIVNYLRSNPSIRVATWWETANWVKEAGGGLYLVQDIETSYYSDKIGKENVLKTYELGLKTITINSFQKAVLKYVYNVDAIVIGQGINTNVFEKLPVPREKDRGIYCYRQHYLKNPTLMATTLINIRNELPQFKLFTYGGGHCTWSTKHLLGLNDFQVAEEINKSSVFISTSNHEGFCLPILEAMACGVPIVTTPSTGNETFCINGVNCLIGNNAKELSSYVIKLSKDKDLSNYLITNALKTVDNYSWDKVIDKLEKVIKDEARLLNL
jgi:glycosyltransferase involved in cell wall biosynthesis